MRPAMQLASSPGIESSVIGGNDPAKCSWTSSTIVRRVASGSAAKLGVWSSCRANSGKETRKADM